MLTDRAVSTDILDHGAAVRLAGFAPPALHREGCRDPGTAPRDLSPTPPGPHTPPLMARPGDHVRVDAAAPPRTTPPPHRPTRHTAGMAPPSHRTEMDLPQPTRTPTDQRR